MGKFKSNQRTCLCYRFYNKHLPSSHHPIFFCLVSHSTSNHIQRLMLQSVPYRFCNVVLSQMKLLLWSPLVRDPGCLERTIYVLFRDLCTGACKVWKANDWTAGLSNKYTEKRSTDSKPTPSRIQKHPNPVLIWV